MWAFDRDTHRLPETFVFNDQERRVAGSQLEIAFSVIISIFRCMKRTIECVEGTFPGARALSNAIRTDSGSTE